MDEGLLERLDQVLRRRHPYLYANLCEGIAPQSAVAAWTAVGVTDLPAEYLQFMAWHDGSIGWLEIIPNYGALIDLDHATEVWADLNQDDIALQRKVPVLDGEQHYVLYDLDTGCLWDWDLGDLRQTFDSLMSMVQTIAECYETASIAVVQGKYAEIADETTLRAIHARLNPSSQPPPWSRIDE